MTTFAYTWNATFDTLPPDTENFKLGASRIRDFKSALKERLQVDHAWVGDTADGRHNQVSLKVGATPSNPDTGFTTMYLDASGIPTMRKSDGTVVTLGHPIGEIYISVNSANPATYFGYGTWVAFGTGRVLTGIDPAQTEFNTIEKTGGAKTHTLTIGEIPSHNHTLSDPGHTHGIPNAASTSGSGAYIAEGSFTGYVSTTGVGTGITIAAAGGGAAHNTLLPFITVYMWKRTA